MMNHKRKPTSYYRGHSTYYDYETEKWYYEDNDKYIKSENRPYARCGKTPTLNGADYCLKDLEACDFIKAACCGHGERIGYISLQDGRIFREIDSNDILSKMSRLENENKKLKEKNDQLQKKLECCEYEHFLDELDEIHEKVDKGDLSDFSPLKEDKPLNDYNPLKEKIYYWQCKYYKRDYEYRMDMCTRCNYNGLLNYCLKDKCDKMMKSDYEVTIDDFGSGVSIGLKKRGEDKW